MTKKTKPANVGSRSNYSLLPYAVRYKICCLLHDGATTDAVASDPDVKAAYARLGTTLKRSAVTRLKRSREYQSIIARRTEFRRAQEEDDLTAAMLREMDSAENIAESVKIDLLNLVKECVRANPDDPREVERLVRSAVNLSNTAKDNQIAEWKKKYSDLQARFEAAEQEHTAEVARLLAADREKNQLIETLKEELSKFKAQNSGAVIEEMDKFVKGE